MRNPWEVIAELEADNSRLGKEAILKVVANHGNDIFFEGCRLALDPMITFGIKKVPESKINGSGLEWDYFRSKIQGLIDRSVTGHAAQDLVEGLMSLATTEQWNGWYRRILIKDLRCGVSEKTINKVVEEINERYIVPTFACQLSHDSANHEGKLAGKKLVEVKLDGVRVITIAWPDGRVLQFSRNGKELVNFEHIKDQISAAVQASNLKGAIVLDGEVMSNSFQDLMKQVHRKDNVAAGDAVLNLFDILTLDEFNAGVCPMSQQDRTTALKIWHSQHQALMPNVATLSQELVNLDTAEGQAKFREINQRAIAGGYEGIMIKDPAAPYECKRVASWLKLKPYIEVSLNVQDLEEGTGRNVGRLGAFVCGGQDDGKPITVNVGSGFSDAQRDEFWHAHISSNSIIGQVVEIRADAVTQNQDGSYSLRFPRFLRFRGFVAGEKI